jgi:hypothetical protein
MTRLRAIDGPEGNAKRRVSGRPMRGSLTRLRHGLTGITLPPGCEHVQKSLLKLRTALEQAILAARNEVTIVDAGLVQTAIRWEKHSQLAGRWLERSYAVLTPEQRLLFSKESARASSERDRAISMLRLGKQTLLDDIVEKLYQRQPALPPPLVDEDDDEPPEANANGSGGSIDLEDK